MSRVLSKWITVVLLLGFLTACGDQRVLEKQGFIQTIGYDWVDSEDESSGKSVKENNEHLGVTALVPIASASSGKQQIEILHAVARTNKEGKYRLAKQSELSLVSGQIRTVLYGMKLSAKGLLPYLDTLTRDPSVSQRLKIAIVDGTAKEMLEGKYPNRMNTGPYIDHMLDKESSVNNIPKTTLHDFMRDYVDDGIDPVVPIIKKQGKHIETTGIALFDNDRYITRIDADQVLVFAFLRASFKKGEISIDLQSQDGKGESVMFNSLVSKHKVKIKRDPEGESFRADINLKVEGSLLEYIGDSPLKEEANLQKLEAAIEASISARAQQLVRQMQKYKVDSIGIGKDVRNSLHFEEWKRLDWDSVYAKMDIQVHTDVKIKSTGRFEK